MSRWHTLERFDASFYKTAPFRITMRMRIDAPARTAFEILENGEMWPRWVSQIRTGTWTSPAPHGEGTTRTVILTNGAAIKERFIVWTPGSRMGFCVEETTIGGIRRFGEDYQLISVDTGCHIRWTFALEMHAWWMRTLIALIRPAMYLALRMTLRRFVRLVESEYARSGAQLS